MRHTILLILLFGIALFFSLELRPFVITPPENIAGAKSLIIGVWTGTEGSGSFEEDVEIDFHSSYSFTMKIKPRNEEWSETNGFYEIDTVRDRQTNALRCAMSFSIAPRKDYWYFSGGDVLYAGMGSARLVKNMNSIGKLIWYVVIPCAIMFWPARLLWDKIYFESAEKILPPASL